MANENANRFLRSYNKIEAQLKLLYGGKATQNFTDLVKRCTDVNITVRRYESELVDYGKLRNAIVHPTDEATQNIEYIERQLCRPPLVTDVFKVKKMASVFADKPLLTAVQTFAETEKKTLVVYDHGNMAGVINSYFLYRIILQRAAAGEDLTKFLRTTPCGAVLDESILNRYRLLSAAATVFDVFEAFELRKDIYAVIVTENGVVGEKVLALLTPSDFPVINHYIESYNAKTF